MKHLFRRAVGPLGLALVSAGVGCTEEQTGLYIQGNVVLEPPACEARADSSSTLLLGGLLDVAVRLDYVASLLVGNQLTPRGEKENLRTESMIVTISGAEVRLLTDTGEVQTEYTVPASGVIVPDGSDEAGFGVVDVTLIPRSAGLELAGTLARGERRTRVAEVRVFGQTIGGREMESSMLPFVIEVCKACSIDFSEGLQNGECTRIGDITVTSCRPGQDGPTDCRLCAGDSPFCFDPAFTG